MRQRIAIVFGVLFSVACGSQATNFSLPDASPGPDASGPDISLGIDVGGPSTIPDSGEVPDGGGTGPSDAVDDASEPADTAVDTGPQPITSCVGRCGLLLTDQGNPCSCFPSCKTAGNCCADFELSCTCGSDAACDDLDACTQDSCKNGWCLNYPIPQKTCCKTDSECKGGDLCNVAKCLDGQCALQPTDCNDGLDCTQDVCNPADGKCVNKMLTGKCLIDGKCQKAGDVDPESAGCAICDPVKSTTAWSPKVGKCAIAGGCYSSGDANPMAACAICDPSKNPTGWSAKSGQCFIDGQCLAKNAANPDNPSCQVCDPSTPTQWSAVAGKCLIDGQCLADGTPDPSAPDCRKCDVAKSKVGWTAIAGACLVDGVCAKAGGSQPGSGGCAVCDPGKSTTAWTLVANGGKCDDGSVCTTGEVCDGKGTCKGAAKAGCCMADADCATFKFPAGQEPGPCDEVYCQKSAGTCAKKPIAKCCVSGVCCDVPAKMVKPANTPCSTFVKNVEYQCDGQDVQKRSVYNGCTGADAAKCSSDTPGYSDWGTVKTCGAEEVCTPGADKGVVPTCKLK